MKEKRKSEILKGKHMKKREEINELIVYKENVFKVRKEGIKKKEKKTKKKKERKEMSIKEERRKKKKRM